MNRLRLLFSDIFISGDIVIKLETEVFSSLSAANINATIESVEFIKFLRALIVFSSLQFRSKLLSIRLFHKFN